VIVKRRQDERLNPQVQVLVGKVLPDGSAVKQTLASRRKRFRQALTERLVESGWQEVRANVCRSASK